MSRWALGEWTSTLQTISHPPPPTNTHTPVLVSGPHQRVHPLPSLPLWEVCSASPVEQQKHHPDTQRIATELDGGLGGIISDMISTLVALFVGSFIHSSFTASFIHRDSGWQSTHTHTHTHLFWSQVHISEFIPFPPFHCGRFVLHHQWNNKSIILTLRGSQLSLMEVWGGGGGGGDAVEIRYMYMHMYDVNTSGFASHIPPQMICNETSPPPSLHTARV